VRKKRTVDSFLKKEKENIHSKKKKKICIEEGEMTENDRRNGEKD